MDAGAGHLVTVGLAAHPQRRLAHRDRVVTVDGDDRRAEEVAAAPLDQAAVGIALVAPDGRWLRVNPRAAQIVGYSVEELLRMRFQEVTHPDDLAVDEAQIRDLLADRITQYALEKRYRRKDGRSVWVNLSVALLRTAEGEPDYFVSVIEDIDEKKRAQDEAMASKRQLEAALESMTDAVFISDLEGRITSILLTPYPPGIPLLIPGERFNATIVRYLKFARFFNEQFPGFETDIHGLVKTVVDGKPAYFVDCVR